MTTVVFGIKNCDSVKKARRWLEQHDIAYEFSDFRDEQPSRERIHSWIEIVGLDTLINKRSTTFRQLTPEQQQAQDIETWVELIEQQPTLIKRPLLKHDGRLTCGFKPAVYEDLFNV